MRSIREEGESQWLGTMSVPVSTSNDARARRDTVPAGVLDGTNERSYLWRGRAQARWGIGIPGYRTLGPPPCIQNVVAVAAPPASTGIMPHTASTGRSSAADGPARGRARRGSGARRRARDTAPSNATVDHSVVLVVGESLRRSDHCGAWLRSRASIGGLRQRSSSSIAERKSQSVSRSGGQRAGIGGHDVGKRPGSRTFLRAKGMTEGWKSRDTPAGRGPRLPRDDRRSAAVRSPHDRVNSSSAAHERVARRKRRRRGEPSPVPPPSAHRSGGQNAEKGIRRLMRSRGGIALAATVRGRRHREGRRGGRLGRHPTQHRRRRRRRLECGPRESSSE